MPQDSLLLVKKSRKENLPNLQQTWLLYQIIFELGISNIRHGPGLSGLNKDFDF